MEREHAMERVAAGLRARQAENQGEDGSQ